MSTAGHKVVILLATLNGGRFLPEQLESFRGQTHSDWELLVSDDGSADDSLDIIHEFAKTVAQPVTVVNGPRAGYCQNFLSMIQRCQVDGDFFAFSDQDDIWMTEKLERALSWLRSVPPDLPAVYFSRTTLIGESGDFMGFSPLFTRKPSFRNALVQNIGGGNTMVINRAGRRALASISNAAPVSHDWWTYQVVTGVGGAAHYDPWPSVKYRQHAKNLIGSNAGLRAGLRRFRGFLGNRFAIWNETNIKALTAIRDVLSLENRATFDAFVSARQAWTPERPYLVWKSGVYRQNVAETAVLFWGSLLNRI